MSTQNPSESQKKAYYDSLPRKRSAVGVLILQNDKLLVLEPSYKPNWVVPSGVVEKSESPLEAAIRECKEEIGVDVQITSFLCVDYKRGNPDIGDAVHYLFAADTPNNQKIKIDDAEVKSAEWLPIESALQKFDIHLSSRVKVGLQALAENKTYFCEDGEIKV